MNTHTAYCVRHSEWGTTRWQWFRVPVPPAKRKHKKSCNKCKVRMIYNFIRIEWRKKANKQKSPKKKKKMIWRKTQRRCLPEPRPPEQRTNLKSQSNEMNYVQTITVCYSNAGSIWVARNRLMSNRSSMSRSISPLWTRAAATQILDLHPFGNTLDENHNLQSAASVHPFSLLTELPGRSTTSLLLLTMMMMTLNRCSTTQRHSLVVWCWLPSVNEDIKCTLTM